MQLDNHTRVRPFRASIRGRHTINHHLIRAAGSRHDKASGTHTEGIDASLLHLRHEAVLRRRQVVATPLLAVVLDLINQLLRMLQADTDSQSLRLDRDTRGIEVTIDIPCGVAGRQDHRAHKGLAAVGLHPDHPAFPQDKAIHAGLEMYLASTTQDLLTHPLDHSW